MNKIVSSATKAFRFATLSIALTGSLSAFAAPGGPREGHPGSASSAEVKYVGIHEGSPLFNLVYNNSLGAKFSIRILDNEGHLIYQGLYKDKKFDRKFMITNTDGSNLVFVVHNFLDNSDQRFEVNTNVHEVEDVEVTEVK